MSAAEKRTTKVSTKGQVILPKAVREQRRWGAGTKLLVENTEDGVLLRKAPLFAPTTIDQVFGALAWKGKPKSLKDMEEAMETEARRRARD